MFYDCVLNVSAGLSGLKGFALSNVTISAAPGADGTNMNGTINIPNPSVVTVPMVRIISFFLCILTLLTLTK